MSQSCEAVEVDEEDDGVCPVCNGEKEGPQPFTVVDETGEHDAVDEAEDKCWFCGGDGDRP